MYTFELFKSLEKANGIAMRFFVFIEVNLLCQMARIHRMMRPASQICRNLNKINLELADTGLTGNVSPYELCNLTLIGSL